MKSITLLVTSILIIMTTTAFILQDKKQNKLSGDEKKQGWKLLFDGKSMSGWRIYQNKKADSWSVKDGALYCKGSSNNKSEQRADIITTAQYENFEFSVDWKISPQGNSGIIYLFDESEKSSYLTGPEYQIIDDNGYPAKLEEWQKTASNYAMDAAHGAVPGRSGNGTTRK
jgi:hypothetical protein